MNKRSQRSSAESCTWATPHFPTQVKNRYKAWVHANGMTVRDHLEYLILKAMREAGVDVPKIELTNLLKRLHVSSPTPPLEPPVAP